MSAQQQFSPNVKCPHCQKSNLVSVSGYGAKYNNRFKFCTKCQKPYYVEIFVTTSVQDTDTTNMTIIYMLEQEIKNLRKEVKIRKKELEEIRMNLIDNKITIENEIIALENKIPPAILTSDRLC